MKIRPIRDQVLVCCEEAKGVTEGGIILPDISKDKPCKGEILAIGPGRPYDSLKEDMCIGSRVPMSVKVGDKVFFQRFAGNVIPDQEQLLLIRENEIMAIIEE